MTVKRKDFQKAAAVVHEFLLKLSEDAECAELRDALNLALLHMQRYYRTLRNRLQTQEKSNGHILSTSLRGLSPMTPFKDAPDKFQWKWVSLDNPKMMGTLPADLDKNAVRLPFVLQAAKEGDCDLMMQLIEKVPNFGLSQQLFSVRIGRNAPTMCAEKSCSPGEPNCVYEVDALGRTALMYAVHFGHLDMVQMLLEHNAEVDATANDGTTAVHRACHDGNHEALQILIEYRADLVTQDSHGRAPVHWACASPNRQCLKLLIENGVSVNTRDREGMSPSMWACRLDHIEHFELLSGVANQHVDEEDGFERDNLGRTWMHWSVRRTEPLECLKTLLTEDSACMKDYDGRTVMATAAEMGSLSASKLVLEIAGKSCLDHRDEQNRTPLMLATIGGHGEVVNFLLAEGADLSCLDNFGATAWNYACGRQLHYCMLIIASYIRQQVKEEEYEEPMDNYSQHLGVPDGMEMANQTTGSDSDGQPMYESKSVTPHPPRRPPTPRGGGLTPRAPTTPRNGARTPRGAMTPTTPQGPPGTARSVATPRAPLTPRGAPRAPSAPAVMEDGGQPMYEHQERDVSSAGSGGSKRKKSDESDEDYQGAATQEMLMSVGSMDSGEHHSGSPHTVPPMHAPQQQTSPSHSYHGQGSPAHSYHGQGSASHSYHGSPVQSYQGHGSPVHSHQGQGSPPLSNHNQQSHLHGMYGGQHGTQEGAADDNEDANSCVSIGAMDVSDLEGEDGDDEREMHHMDQELHSPPPHPPPQPQPRYQRPHHVGPPSPTYTHPMGPPYMASPQPQMEAGMEGHMTQESHHAPPPTPRHPPSIPTQGVEMPSASMEENRRVVPPAHLSPLPTTSLAPPPAGHKPKKKKKKKKDTGQPLPPPMARGYGAPGGPAHPLPPPVGAPPIPREAMGPPYDNSTAYHGQGGSVATNQPAPLQQPPSPSLRPASLKPPKKKQSVHHEQEQSPSGPTPKPGPLGPLPGPAGTASSPTGPLSSPGALRPLQGPGALDSPRTPTLSPQTSAAKPRFSLNDQMKASREPLHRGTTPRPSNRTPPLPQAVPSQRLQRMDSEDNLNVDSSADENVPSDSNRPVTSRGRLKSPKQNMQQNGGLQNGQVLRDNQRPYNQQKTDSLVSAPLPGANMTGGLQRRKNSAVTSQKPPTPKARRGTTDKPGGVPPLTAKQMPNGRLPSPF